MPTLNRSGIVGLLAAQASGNQAQSISRKAGRLWNNTGVAFQPVAQLKSSQNLVAFLKKVEGSRPHRSQPGMLRLYNDPSNDCTVGYGKFLHSGVCNGTDPSEQPYLNGITPLAAEQLLLQEMAIAEHGVQIRLKGARLTQHMFDAYVSLIYNTGLSKARATWKVFTEAQNGNYNNAATEFLNINKSKGVALPGLTVRRQMEHDMFLYAKY